MSTVDLDKAFGTDEAAKQLSMKPADLLRYVSKHVLELKPPDFKGRYLWTPETVGAVADHMSRAEGVKQRVAEARKSQTCLHCGGKPFDPEGYPRDKMADVDASVSTAPEGGGDGDGED